MTVSIAVSGLPSQLSAQLSRPQLRSVWFKTPASACTIHRQRLAPTTDGIAQGRMTSTRIADDAAHLGIENEGRAEPQGHSQRNAAGHPDERPPEEGPCFRVAEDAREIVEAHERGSERRELHPAEAEVERLKDRVHHHQGDERHRRCDQDVARRQPPLRRPALLLQTSCRASAEKGRPLPGLCRREPTPRAQPSRRIIRRAKCGKATSGSAISGCQPFSHSKLT